MILAVDTASATLGIALLDGTRILAEQELPADGRHTVELAPAVDAMLRRAGAEPSALKAVGVAQGPGSFTALRIGLAFAVGLALPRNLPVVGISTFDIIAGALTPGKVSLVAVVRAGRGRVAWQVFRPGKRAWLADGAPQVTDVAALVAATPRKALVCGELDRDGQAAIAKRRDLKLAPPHLCLRRAGVLATLAAEKLQEAKGRPPLPMPVYLHTLESPVAESKGHATGT
jgi:tRNA threonylcarbamoyladenosine biosynthesis protein TsaB